MNDFQRSRQPEDDFSHADAESLGQLVRSAAHAADCAASVLIVVRDGQLSLRKSFGLDQPVITAAARRLVEDTLTGAVDGLLHVVSQPDGEGDEARLFGSHGAPMRFAVSVAVTVGFGARGALVVADPSPRTGFTAAQTYVLRCHAAQLSRMLDAERAGPASALAADVASERLRLMEAVVVNANDAVLITKRGPIEAPGPEIVYCNGAMTRMTGYAEHELLGQNPRMLQSPNTDRKALDRIRAALLSWQSAEVEVLNRKKDGTEFWVELSIVPVIDEAGTYTHWVSVQRDVTERKLAGEVALRARIAENISLAAEVRERRAAESKLLYTAFHDDLTRLRNRAFFMDRLGVALELAKSNRDSHCAVLFLDLDGFKLVNDSLGHRAGDLLLIEVAQRLRSCIRPADTLARLGGDEFAIIIESSNDLPPVETLATRIIDTIKRPVWLGKQEVFCSCSIGIAMATQHYRSPQDMLRDADIAMYTSKRQEPGTITIFGEAMHETAVQALALHTDLRNAVRRREFVLDYQPIFHAATRRVVAVEALVRWRHPRRGNVVPADFVAAAEQGGLIREIGRWVMREACMQMRAWRERFPVLDLRISVNVSGKELRDAGFIAHICETLRESGLPPTALQIEITESVFLVRAETVGAVLTTLRKLGVRVALDDFGTGYSSLSFIDRYPMDAIKIDRAFVGRMLDDHRTMAIVRSISQLGRGLTLDIVAEGVENEDQLRALEQTGCGFVQGFLLGSPASPLATEALLAAVAVAR